MHCQVSPLIHISNTKTILVLIHSHNFFIMTKTISDSPFLQGKVSVVNSAGGSFCWNLATDTFYSSCEGANVCCNYADFEVLLQLYWWYFLLYLCWWIFFCSYEGDYFSCNYAVRSFCNTYAGESF